MYHDDRDVQKLLRSLPLAWAEQRQRLGFLSGGGQLAYMKFATGRAITIEKRSHCAKQSLLPRA